MTFDQTVQVVGVVVTALGFCVLIVQFYLGLRLIKSDKISRIYSELHEIQKVFVEHPELRPYFFHRRFLATPSLEQETMPAATLYYRARAVAEMFFDAFEHIYLLRSEATSDFLEGVEFAAGDIKQNWDDYIDGMLASSPFLADYMLEVSPTIHPPKLASSIRQSIKTHWPEISERHTRNCKQSG